MVKRNREPLERVDVQLVLNVGSIVEGERERGLAHFCEHLAFRASSSQFQNHYDVVRHLESLGSRFGPCQNAMTAFDETVYELHVATEVLPQALRVLQHFATAAVRATDEDVNEERKIILEELRQDGHSAETRSREQFFETALGECVYGQRLPMGLQAVIEDVPPAVVRNFARCWYRLENMCVVVVGDVDDEEAVVAMVSAEMSPDGPRETLPPPRSRPEASRLTDWHATPRVCLFLDDCETSESSVSLDYMYPRTHVQNVRDVRRSTVETLFTLMFNERCAKVAARPSPPFYRAEMAIVEHTLTMRTLTVHAEAVQGEEIASLTALLTEIERIARFGFDANELRMATANVLASLEAQFIERDQTDSTLLASDLVDYFLSGNTPCAIQCLFDLTSQLLEDISLSDLNDISRLLLPTNNLTVSISRPGQRAPSLLSFLGASGQRYPTITEQHVRDALCAATARLPVDALEHWTDVPTDATLDVPSLPPPGHTEVEHTFTGELELHEFVLSNGVRVCFRRTEFAHDDIVMRAFAFGGTSSLTREQLNNVRVASAVAEAVGEFGIVPARLAEMLAGRRVTLSTAIELYTRTLAGLASPRHLEDFFRLLHLRFVSRVEHSNTHVQSVLTQLRQSCRTLNHSVDEQFARFVDRLNTNGNDWLEPLSESDLERVDTVEGLERYNGLFTDASHFTFSIVGSTSLDVLRPLCERYLGSLPTRVSSAVPRCSLVPLVVDFSRRRMVPAVLSMELVEPFAIVRLSVMVKVSGANPTEQLRRMVELTVACGILRTELLEALRMVRGAVYDVNVLPSFPTAVPQHGADMDGIVSIMFTCAPSITLLLAAEVFDVIHRLRSRGVSRETLHRVLTSNRRDRETSRRTNAFWCEHLNSSYQSRRYREDNPETVSVEATLLEYFRMDERVQSDEYFTPSRSRIVMERFFPASMQVTLAILKPKVRWWRSWKVLGGVAAVAVAAAVVVMRRRH